MPRSAVLILAAVLALLASAAMGCGGDAAERAAGPARAAEPPAALPAPRAALPREPAALARALAETTLRLRAEIEAWRREGNPARGAPPEAVTLLALHQQRIHRRLEARPRVARAVLARLPRRVLGQVRDTLLARRALRAIPIPPGAKPPPIRTTDPVPAGALLRHYRRAQARFGVGWHVLAAINFVETSFGRIRSRSSAGAQGPMQFMPATWAAYGLGGDVDDPRDAILGAANYLRASGAPGRVRAALFAYNRSSAYVSAVLRFARRMRRDPRTFYAWYAWQVYWPTPEGVRRVTGPR